MSKTLVIVTQADKLKAIMMGEKKDKTLHYYQESFVAAQRQLCLGQTLITKQRVSPCTLLDTG